MTAVLEGKNLNKKFKGNHAVAGVSLSLKEAEIYALIGPDGAGKTTTLRMLAGVMKPDSGGVQVFSQPLDGRDDAQRQRIGYMPQAYGLYANLSVEENLTFFARLQGMTKKDRLEKIDSLLKFIRLQNFKSRKAGALSGGMYKKLAIACAVVHSPEVLILDEPTNGVDPVSRRELWSLLFDLSSRNVSIIVSTPYMDEAERAHRTGLLFEGHLAGEGAPSELLATTNDELIKIETSQSKQVLALVRKKMQKDISGAYLSASSVHVLAQKSKNRDQLVAKIEKGLTDNKIKYQQVKPARAIYEDLFMKLQFTGALT